MESDETANAAESETVISPRVTSDDVGEQTAKSSPDEEADEEAEAEADASETEAPEA